MFVTWVRTWWLSWMVALHVCDQHCQTHPRSNVEGSRLGFQQMLDSHCFLTWSNSISCGHPRDSELFYLFPTFICSLRAVMLCYIFQARLHYMSSVKQDGRCSRGTELTFCVRSSKICFCFFFLTWGNSILHEPNSFLQLHKQKMKPTYSWVNTWLPRRKYRDSSL